jgi:CHAD domain-containing protein
MASHPQQTDGSRRFGLRFWMQRVLKECVRVEKDFPADAVHDLRVALRRCRSLARGMEEIDQDRAWQEMSRAGRKLFRRLGALRDLQVLADWTSKLRPKDDAAGQALLDTLAAREPELREEAAAALKRFDVKEWQHWSRLLAERVRRLAPDGLVAQHIAVQRLEEARALHRRALRNRNPAAWHQLRIGIKRFRYIVENFLPERHALWGADLKRLQDLLGEVHDLDVFWETLPEAGVAFDAEAQARWKAAIEQERGARLDSYRAEMAGRKSLWTVWRDGLPQGSRLEAAANAKLSAWAAFLDPDVAHSRHVGRLALELFDGIAALGANGTFSNPASRRLLSTAALLHATGRSQGKKGHHKAAYRLISHLQPPLCWSKDELQRVALLARYTRGAEPSENHKGFARLEPPDRQAVRVLAGLLRLADGFDADHKRSVHHLEVKNGRGFLLIRPDGWEETQENAAVIGGRKHLLEIALGRPVIVRGQAAESSSQPPPAEAAALPPVLVEV